MQTKSYELEGLAQGNTFLTSSNSAVMAQLAQMNMTMNYMQAQLKTLSLSKNNPSRTKRKFIVIVVGETILMCVKPSWQRNWATRKMNTNRSDWAETKKGVNDG